MPHKKPAPSPRHIVIDARIIRSGTGRYVERLLHYLEQLDTTNRYTVLLRKKDLSYYQPQNPNFHAMSADFANYSFGEQLGLARLLYKLKPDLVHFCMPQQPLLYFGRAVTTVHDLNLLRITSNDDMGENELRVKKLVFRALLWIVAHRSAHIITPSEYTKKDLIAFARTPAHRVTVTYEGGDIAAHSPEPIKSLEGSDFLLYVGRTEPYKNNRGLMEAHHELLAKYPYLRLVIVGPKDTLRLADIAWARAQGFMQIDFLGFLSNEQLAWLYKNCRAYVFPSFMEGFGLPGLEAMSSGAPVISSNATSLPEVYRDGAHYFDPRSSHGMALTIDEVLRDGKLRAELIRNGQRVAKRYSWKKMAAETLGIYLQLM